MKLNEYNQKPEKIELDELLLAMDVVVALRHEQQLVERELASAERDQALFEKVKRMYASQGLEVTDKMIAEGVAALREERFGRYRRRLGGASVNCMGNSTPCDGKPANATGI